MRSRMSRRRFLGKIALAGAGWLILRQSRSAWSYQANEKLNMALVGGGARGTGFVHSAPIAADLPPAVKVPMDMRRYQAMKHASILCAAGLICLAALWPSSALAKDKNVVLLAGKPDTPLWAWGWQREEGGRGFGFIGGHSHTNWNVEGLRKAMLNAILWTANMEVPAATLSVRPLHPRRIELDAAKPVTIQAFVLGSMIETFINDQYALSCRAYDEPTGKLGFSASGGDAAVLELKVKVAQ